MRVVEIAVKFVTLSVGVFVQMESGKTEKGSTQYLSRLCSLVRHTNGGFIGGKCENILNNKYLMVTNVYRSARLMRCFSVCFVMNFSVAANERDKFSFSLQIDKHITLREVTYGDASLFA
jgi:hypothetical protein